MKRIAYLSLLLGTAHASTLGLAGKMVPPYPNESFSHDGLCVSIQNTCDHAIGVVETSSRVPIELVALGSLGRKSDGTPLWQVTDEIEVPALATGQFLGQCVGQLAGAYAIMDIKARGGILRASWAVQLDASIGRFKSLRPADVQCADTSVGAD
jgi:hypothetical protein